MYTILCLYPERIEENSPGSRSDSDDHPGLGHLLDWHPERRARNAVVTPDVHAFSDPLPGSNTLFYKVPRVFVAIAPRPGATISDPCRDQEAIPPGLNPEWPRMFTSWRSRLRSSNIERLVLVAAAAPRRGEVPHQPSVSIPRPSE